MAIEKPKYRVVVKEGGFELREYDGYIKAEVGIKSKSYGRAVLEGFEIIADFIFGNNTKKQSIAMTAPVMQSADYSEKIAMTAPVNARLESPGCYQIAFVMPSKYTMETLPVPNNKKIVIKKIEAFKAAVVVFSGFVNEKTIEKKMAELQEWITKNNLKATGEMDIARYNPPWTPWFLRRNEIIVHLK